MDMPPPSMSAYADVPAVIQARGAASPLLVDAVKAMSDARALTLRLPNPSARPVPAAGDREPSAVERIRPSDYADIVGRTRERLGREVPAVPGFDVTVLDNSTDAVKDAKERFGRESLVARTFVNYYRIKGNSPFTSYVPASRNPSACVIMPAPPTMTMADFKVNAYGGRINVGSATARDFQGWVTSHELGHCLLGPDETSADVFGLLVMIHDGADRDLVASVAAVRESNELLSPVGNDDYFVAAAVGWLARNYDRIRADPGFMSSDTAGVARYAKGVADRFAIDDVTKSDHKMARVMLVAAQRMPFHLVKGLDGKPRRTDFDGWLAAHAREVPLFARVLDLKRRLDKGPGELPAPFVVDGPGTMNAMSRLARAGDPTAAAAIRTVTTYGFPVPVVSPMDTAYKLRDDHDDAKRLFDREPPPAPARHDIASAEERDEGPTFHP